MSKAAAARTEASPNEQASRAVDLHFEIQIKLSQAKGICTLICGAHNVDDAISESASAAEDLIEGVEKALEELDRIEPRHSRGGGVDGASGSEADSPNVEHLNRLAERTTAGSQAQP